MQQFANSMSLTTCIKSKFMRNAPPPPMLSGYHEELTGTDTPVWYVYCSAARSNLKLTLTHQNNRIDMVPITFRPIGSIESYLVDFGKKNYE
jgi:hypothetical protein